MPQNDIGRSDFRGRNSVSEMQLMSTVRRITLALLIAVACPVQSVIASTLNILCIGDSITQGGRGGRPEYTYRLPLQKMLIATGRNVDFIGTQKKGLDGSPWPASFDPDHEGYYGQTTAQVMQHLADHLPQLEAPDIALIHLGTNDGWNETTKSMREIVRLLRVKNPRIEILIAEPPVMGLKGTWLRFQISRMAGEVRSAKSPVRTVPMPNGWGPQDTFDLIHPNERGQMRLAIQWLAAIAAL
jgi:lysophospholipase L1-like esterase